MKDIESDCIGILERFAVDPSVETAKKCLIDLTETIGPGFHPDTPFSEYVAEDWSPLFGQESVESLDQTLKDVMHLLIQKNVDPYDVAHDVQRRLLGM